jgi:hypothetical protein
MMSLKAAVEQVGLAGRELGSGPAIVLARFPDLVHELGSYGFREQTTLEAVALGVIYGMLAEGNPMAEARLREIHQDWTRDHAAHGVADARGGQL